MRKYLIGLVALIALVVVTPVQAAETYITTATFSSNKIVESCEPTTLRRLYFLTGVVDALVTLRGWGVIARVNICIPTSAIDVPKL